MMLGLLGLLLTPGFASPSRPEGDALALVQRSLFREPTALESPLSPVPFLPGSPAEVAVPAINGGVEFVRCSVLGTGASPDSYDIYLAEVAPAFRKVNAVPWELLRHTGTAGLPAANLTLMFDGGAPDARRDVVDRAVGQLRQSTQAPMDPTKAAELKAARLHDAVKQAALKERREKQEQEEDRKRKRWDKFADMVTDIGSRAKSQLKRGRKANSSSFESLDRNGDGVVTRDEFHKESEETRAQVEKLKAWEVRAKDWPAGCSANDKPQLAQALKTIQQEKAEVVLSRLPATCTSKALGSGSDINFKELVTCMQELTNTTSECATCPVKFMISLALGCPRRCASLAQGCDGRDTCRAQGAECLNCVRMPTLRLMHCMGRADLEMHFSLVRITDRNTEVFGKRLARLVGGREALWELKMQAWAVQRLIIAWGLDPTGFDVVAKPMLRALGVKPEEELKKQRPKDDGSPSALITAEEMQKYDADGSGSLDDEELRSAIGNITAGRAPPMSRKERKKAAKKAEEEAKRQKEEEAKKKEQEEAERKAKELAEQELMKQAAEVEARRRAEDEAAQKAMEAARLEAEAARKAEEEARKAAEEEARKKAEEEEAKRKAEEEERRKAEEEAKRKAEEEAKRIADAEAKRIAEEEAKKREEEARVKAIAEAKQKAIDDAKRKAEEDARKAEEAERRRIESDPKLKAQEDAWKEALAEEAEQAKQKAEEDKKKAEEAAKLKQKAEEEAKKKAEEEAKMKAAAAAPAPAPAAQPAQTAAAPAEEEVS